MREFPQKEITELGMPPARAAATHQRSSKGSVCRAHLSGGGGTESTSRLRNVCTRGVRLRVSRQNVPHPHSDNSSTTFTLPLTPLLFSPRHYSHPLLLPDPDDLSHGCSLSCEPALRTCRPDLIFYTASNGHFYASHCTLCSV